MIADIADIAEIECLLSQYRSNQLTLEAMAELAWMYGYVVASREANERLYTFLKVGKND